MPSLTDKLKLLRREPAEAVASFAASALPHAEPHERETLLRAALASRRPANIAAAIGLLHAVGPDVTRDLVEASTPLGEAFALLLRRGDPRALGNAVAVARRRAQTSLLPSLVACLDAKDDEENVPQRAAEALLAMDRSVLRQVVMERIIPALDELAALGIRPKFVDHNT